MPSRHVVRVPRAAGSSGASQELPTGNDVYVGIDPSLTGYGIVLWWPDGHAHRDVLIKTSSDRNYAQRLTEIRDTVARLLSEVSRDVRLICMERPAYDASGAFTGGLVHAATAFALLDVWGMESPHIAPVLVAGNTLKKFATGKGVGKKGLMVKYVWTKWGFDTDDDNLADAYWLARLAAAVASGTSEHQYERDCIEVVRKGMPWGPQSANGAASVVPRNRSRSSLHVPVNPPRTLGEEPAKGATQSVVGAGRTARRTGRSRGTAPGSQPTPTRSSATR